jgi:hypothetical protein
MNTIEVRVFSVRVYSSFQSSPDQEDSCGRAQGQDAEEAIEEHRVSGAEDSGLWGVMAKSVLYNGCSLLYFLIVDLVFKTIIMLILYRL